MSEPTAAYKAKEFVAKTSLLALGVTFELASKYDPDLQKEIETWPEDMVFSMGILPNGPCMSAKREGNRVRYLGLGLHNPDLIFYFKNLDSALLSFTGQIGTHTAVAQCRIAVHGNTSDGMKVARAMNIVQAYLFPGILLRMTYKRAPKFTPAQLWIKTKVMAMLTPGLVLNMAK